MSPSDPRSRGELISDIGEHVMEEIRGQAAVVSVRLICRLAWIDTRHAVPDHVELKPRPSSNPVERPTVDWQLRRPHLTKLSKS